MQGVFPAAPHHPDTHPHPGPPHPAGRGQRPGPDLGGRDPGVGGRGYAGLLRDLARWLQRADPDLVLSDWGDEEIIPTLWHWSRQHRREPAPGPGTAAGAPAQFRGRTYFSYGRIVYQGPSVPFYGRWHLDRRNSFFYRETGLSGLVQSARLGQIPLQQVARTSPGTLITSMQLARAMADNILIPWRKGEPERFKTAGELLVIDKGGLVFQPPMGFHYPGGGNRFRLHVPHHHGHPQHFPGDDELRCCSEAMSGSRGRAGPVHRSFPPDVTSSPMIASYANQLLCGSARGGAAPAWPSSAQKPKVPEADYVLCQQREGLVPRTLKPILELRGSLKRRAKEPPPDPARRRFQGPPDRPEMDAGHLLRLSGLQERPLRPHRGPRSRHRLRPG